MLGSNNIIFTMLGLDKHDTITNILGYEPHDRRHSSNSFPEVKTLEDLEKVINWLQNYINKDKPLTENLIYY